MRKGPSREPRKDGLAVLILPTSERSSLMKWANFRTTRRSLS